MSTNVASTAHRRERSIDSSPTVRTVAPARGPPRPRIATPTSRTPARCAGAYYAAPVAEPFPSLLIRADALVPQGAFAEAQAEYLHPDPAAVGALTEALRAHDVGVVAHFYMDPQLQGVLSASDWPHIHISDSLVMADKAVAMVRAGARVIVVLGVDFMSENVRAVLDAAGHADVPVYRVASDPIGCSLAESAEAPAYAAYLRRAAGTPKSLHVVYINTSLLTKARAHHVVPTITCTSSNVVQTILQAAAQVPGIHVWFGPDTYMGHNLVELFEGLAAMGDAAVHEVHPDHDAASLRSLLGRFHAFEQGVCVVHHMFGARVAERVRSELPDAFVTAHLEVPGEMFTLAVEAQRRGRGTVGSTSNILGFIARKVADAVEAGRPARLPFVLGTEAGMITAIVRKTQALLRERGTSVEAEIIFPVAAEAIAATGDELLAVVPGVAAGEGCSVEGGCATCPFMKMNSLDALMDLLASIGRDDPRALDPFRSRQYLDVIDGRTVADLGGEPIVHMRGLSTTGRVPEQLVQDILRRSVGHRRATTP